MRSLRVRNIGRVFLSGLRLDDLQWTEIIGSVKSFEGAESADCYIGGAHLMGITPRLIDK